MRYSISLTLVLTLALGLTTARAQTEYTADGSPTGLEEQIRWLVNRGRFDSASENRIRGTAYADVPASAGPLAPNQSLTQAARHQSEDMATKNLLQHATVPGSAYYNPTTEPNPWDRMAAEGYSWNIVAENIAGGYSDANSVYVAWWNSTGHRENMYNSTLREIGIGYSFSSSSTYQSYYTIDLGSSGSSCFFTDTTFQDANGNGVYDQTEGVADVIVMLIVGTSVQSYYDSSSAVGSFAVPIASIPSGSTVQVVLANAGTAAVTLSVPRDYRTYTTVTLAPGEKRVLGTFIRAAAARNVGFRDLTPA
jgi:uncharacterized protein YkwD